MVGDVDNDEFEPLECLPLPVAIEAHDVGVAGPTIVRLFFRSGSLEPLPGGELSNVVVLEQWDRVAIGLVRRVVEGDAPNDISYGGELLIQYPQVSLDVELHEPLATRPLIDASTGHTVPRVERTTADLLPAEALGTPRWIST